MTMASAFVRLSQSIAALSPLFPPCATLIRRKPQTLSWRLLKPQSIPRRITCSDGDNNSGGSAFYSSSSTAVAESKSVLYCFHVYGMGCVGGDGEDVEQGRSRL